MTFITQKKLDVEKKRSQSCFLCLIYASSIFHKSTIQKGDGG